MVIVKEIDLVRVESLRNMAIVKRLWLDPSFFNASIEELAACYNGIGPDRWGGVFRGVVTWILRSFEEDALPHDWEYSLPKKSYGKFTMANVRLALNAFASGGFWHGCLGVVLALLCQLGGYSGYQTGCVPDYEVK